MKDPRTWEVVIFETPSSERTKALFTHKRLGELTVQWRNKRAKRSLSTLVLLWRLSDRMFRNGLHVVTFSFILRVSNLVWHLLIDSSASLAANQRHGPCPTEAWKQDKKGRNTDGTGKSGFPQSNYGSRLLTSNQMCPVRLIATLRYDWLPCKN